MKYFIQRELNEYGPYTLADLQRYVAQGNIQLTDLTRSEGMTEWVPVSQVIGNIPAAAAAAPPMQIPVSTPTPAEGTVYGGQTAPGGGTVYSGTGTVYDGQSTGYGMQAMPALNTPVPTDFHWGLVLLIGVCTCGLFSYAWLIVEAAFTKKLRPASNAMLLVILGIAGFFVGGFVGGFLGAMNHGEASPIGPLINIAAFVVYIIGIFKMKSDLEDYYNSTEPINLQLSGVMTFFFNVMYFQYHLSRIAKWKKTGVLQPQG